MYTGVPANMSTMEVLLGVKLQFISLAPLIVHSVSCYAADGKPESPSSLLSPT